VVIPPPRRSIDSLSLSTGAIGLRLWLVHRETVKAGVQVDDSIIMVHAMSHPPLIAPKGTDQSAADSGP